MTYQQFLKRSGFAGYQPPDKQLQRRANSSLRPLLPTAELQRYATSLDREAFLRARYRSVLTIIGSVSIARVRT